MSIWQLETQLFVSPYIWLAYIFEALQYIGDVSQQKIKCWPMRTQSVSQKIMIGFFWIIRLFKALGKLKKRLFLQETCHRKGKKGFFSRFLWHEILTSSDVSANAGKVMSWLRFRFSGLPFSVSILSSCLDLLLLPTSLLALLAFLIITFTFPLFVWGSKICCEFFR